MNITEICFLANPILRLMEMHIRLASGPVSLCKAVHLHSAGALQDA